MENEAHLKVSNTGEDWQARMTITQEGKTESETRHKKKI